VNRHARFVAVVSAGAVVQETMMYVVAQVGRELPRVSNRDVLDIVGRATEIPEYALPEDTTSAARHFLSYALGIDGAPRWYVTWRESEGSDLEW
jgi:hypothetical protein